MRITLVSSCGLVLEQDGSALLIDALNKQFRCYYGLPPEVFECWQASRPMTPSAASCLPTRTPTITAPAAGAAPRGLRRAGFPSAAEHAGAPDDAAWPVYGRMQPLSAHPRSGYGRSPARCILDLHCRKKHLCDCRRADRHGTPPRHSAWPPADAAFWNGQYLSHPETRELLLEAAVKNYIYHIPVDEKDVCGIRRKCERSMPASAQNSRTSLLEQYPSSPEA